MTTTSRVLGALVFTSMVACAGGGSDGGGGNGDSGVVPPDDGEPVVIEPENLIDDLDDGDGSINETGGRIGAWYVYNDETATGQQTPDPTKDFAPAAGGPNDAGFMAQTTGSGFTEWGAGMGFDLNNPGEAKGIWDASAFKGVAFVARGDVAIRAAIVVEAVVPVEAGGKCVPGTAEGEECDDAHGRSIVLTNEWRQYKVPFDQITQDGWGQPAPFDAATVTGVQFQIPAGATFDVAIDEIGFY